MLWNLWNEKTSQKDLIMKNIIVLTFLILIVGCTPPPALIKKEAESVLAGECLKLFSCGMPTCNIGGKSVFGYNYGNFSWDGLGKRKGNEPIQVFALAISKDKRQQVCASTHPQTMYKSKGCGGGCYYTLKESQDLALQSCESVKLTTHIFPKDWDKCEIYAIGWNIVYKKKTDVKVKKSEVVKPTPTPATTPTPKVSIDDAKKQCEDIGFKAGTEKFGECVLRLNR